MFAEDFLAQFPEPIREALIADQAMCVDYIAAMYSDNSESFAYKCIPDSSPANYQGDYFQIMIKLKSNSLGYMLTSLLNIDLNTVSEIVGELEWKIDADPNSDPPINYKAVYNRLLSISDVFKLYLPTEWIAWYYDLAPLVYKIDNPISTLKNYIAFCNRKQIPYIGQFFRFLVSNGYFDIAPVFLMPYDEAKLFHGLVDGDGKFTADLDKIYDAFMHGFDPSAVGKNFYILRENTRLWDAAIISFFDIGSRGKIIRQCQNCGKYFIPANRSDTLYCDNPSPEAPEMTCKEYGSRRLWYERQKDDELATLSRKIASAKGMLAKRNPDISEYAESYEYFKKQRLLWMKEVKAGRKTMEEYREWLLYMQSQKRIKEASNG